MEARLKAEASGLGFALAGIAPATEADGFAHFADWLDRGYAGEMDYLRRGRDARRHPRSVLANVRSVLMVGLEYSSNRLGEPPTRPGEPGDVSPPEEAAPNQSLSGTSRSPEVSLRDTSGGLTSPGSPETGLTSPGSPKGKVAAYARGPDYHRLIWDRLNDLAGWLEAEAPGCAARGVTDTAPLLERDFARRAGLGWVGKNTMLIHPRRGSFFFLGALLTDLALTPDEPFAASHCGTCTACLDACPTGAFPQPHVLDASRCISYLTIELRSPMPEELREKVGDWVFGCDVCQDVCPWNRDRRGARGEPVGGSPHSTAGGRPVAFPHDPGLEWLDPVELLGLDEAAFRARFRGTSLTRAKRSGLRRNAAVVLGNVGDERALPALKKALADPDEVVRDAAAWALGRIRQRTERDDCG